MDIKTLLDNLHEEVSCSVCMCKYTDPKLLPCFHSFCLHCLNGIQRTSASRDKIACPECRQEFRVPGNGNLSALPTNFRINSLLDVLAIKECNTTSVKCENCDKRFEKTFYCFQCCSFWCNDCISFHNGMKGNKNHYSLALKDFEDEDFENILKRPAFCGKPGHEKKELEFFCKSCEVAICYTCIATLHEGHPKVLLNEAANERKLQMSTAIEYQKLKVKNEMDKIAKLDENVVKIQEQAACVKRDVQQFVDDIITVIQDKKIELFDEVEGRERKSLERLGIQKHETEQHVQIRETAIEKLETVLKRSTSAQTMQPNDFLDKIFQEKDEDEEDTADPDDKSFREFDFVKNQKLFADITANKIGSLRCFLITTRPNESTAEGKGISEGTVGLETQIVVTTRTANREQCYEQHDYVTVEIKNRQGHDCATKAQVKDNKDGTYKINYFAKETGICEASVKVNGEHVRGSPFKVQVRPRQFRPVLSFGQEGSSVGMFRYPLGVAVNERNEIAVTDVGNNRLQVFSSNGTHLRSFGKKGDQQGEFYIPAGIAFHNDNIIVVDSKNHRVQLLSDQGEQIAQFGGEGSLDHQLKYPYGLFISSDGNVIVTDSKNKLIKIFTLRGQFLRKIGAEGYLTKPLHCIQHDDFLMVSDRGDHCVKYFDLEGNFINKFGKNEAGDGEFNEPACMSVNKAGHLMVCDTGNHRVQVFEISGKFVTKFGTEGSKLGEFLRPLSIAVHNDGRIVVSDSLNKRIQIFE